MERNIMFAQIAQKKFRGIKILLLDILEEEIENAKQRKNEITM